ncbi:flotillin family protein [Bradyrhizobium yuanmingense]|uniref:flotillin family protein n=1 Tax=Bradyrhizobium TaxID=374 RepID=UPI0012F9D82A|nr:MULTISPECIES: flotillin domain-containing protein [Bradyrhizobium]MDA9546401.1 membrane protein [Bradyrhizobium sp. CCBAU 45321]MDF0497654.1 flotillin domain-containing protein [Bradyrhizobium yuanmingense]MDF0581282.1 flotillin domain-containing protein [Bradyrhizobium yuanmingense]MVT52002.1 flotillin family protein [Bradyrhizobium yuanmingense]
MFDIAVPAVIGVALIVVLGIVFTILYKRATRDEAFVRTGLGGKKVVLDGGAMILPIFHSCASVNLKTLRLTVERKERESLITKDRLRVDIVAEFYVRVRPDEESIALASQTLGALTNDAEALRNQVEAKFVDGLRSVAATMSILELQEKRSDFVKHVQSTVESDVKSNGLELESVSLTKLDQTDVKFFNPENFFDAEGLTQLKTVTETRRRDRNAIVRDNEVAIAQKDLEARQQTLGIERTKKEAELSQERDIANKTASTRAEVATATQTARLTEENARIDTDRAVAEKEAGAKQVKETAVIESELAINKRKTDAQREIQIATQENEIQIAAKSKETSEAVAEAKTAEALAVSAEEKVVTARAIEVADRARLTQVLAARTEAERKSTELIVAAEAEKKASLDRAEAVKTLATAEAESNKIKAVGVRNIGEAEAAVITMKNEAQNKLGSNVIDFEIAKKRIETMPSALAEMVKPIANLKDVRILHTGGAFGGNGASGGNVGFGEGLAGELLKVHALRPMIDEILRQSGFAPGDDPVKALVGAVTGKSNGAAVPVPVPEKTNSADL